MQVFFFITYGLIGIIQFFAILDGLEYALDIPRFLAVIIVSSLNFIPLVGSFLGIYGAVNVWDWTLPKAMALFFWYIPAFVIFASCVGLKGSFARRT